MYTSYSTHNITTVLYKTFRIPTASSTMRLLIRACFVISCITTYYGALAQDDVANAVRDLSEDQLEFERELLLDEGLPVTDKALDNDEFVKNWSKHMEGFIPDMTLTFDLEKNEEHFFTEVKDPKKGELIRGAFFATGPGGVGAGKVDCDIHAPDGSMVFEKTDEQGIFYFKGDQKGIYVIALHTSTWKGAARVSLTMGRGAFKWLTPDNVASLETILQKVEKGLVDIQSESTYLWVRQMSAMRGMITVNSRVFWLCVAEFIILIAVAALQMYYIKGLLSDHRRNDFF